MSSHTLNNELAEKVRRGDPFWPVLYIFTKPYHLFDWPELGMLLHIIDFVKRLDDTDDLVKSQKELAHQLSENVERLYNIKTKLYFQVLMNYT